MSLLPKVAWISILAAVALSPASPQATAQTAQVQRVAMLKSTTSTQIEIQTSRRLIPLTQVLTDPDRLVIDFSGAVPSPEIRTITVNNSAVKEVRVGRVTDNPPITRVVIDLKSPQLFQLVPSAHSVIVKIENGSSAAPTAVAKEVPAETVAPTPAAPLAKEAPAETVAPTLTPEAPRPEAPKADAKKDEAAKPVMSAPAPQPVPVRVTMSAPSAAVPVVVRSVPSSPVRAAVMTTAPDPVPTPTPGPTITISRVPVSSSGPAQVRHVAVLKSAGATEIEIEISERVTPEVQAVTGPDRLVIDFPQALPGPQLKAIPVNQGEVKGVRVGLLSAKPPVTRVVLDLKSPQAYQIFPSTRSVIVKLPDSANAGTAAPALQAPPHSPAAPAVPPQAPPPRPPKVDIALQNGKLTLSSTKASLAEVLDELRTQTGAEIVVPPGAEGEVVAVSLGPAAPREVISQLLNGSRYNFIIVGADNDPNRVQRLILTPKTGGGVVPEALPPMPDSTPVGQVETAQGGGPLPVVPPPVEAQPQGDSNPPPDTAPQPGDPQPAPN
jgi:hypothetical protein